MNRILIWSITVALAGFLFGFDTVVISGADKQLQALWHSSDSFHGWVVISSALWGTVLGALFAGYPTNKYGRKNTLIWIGILFSVSAIGSALSNDPITFAIRGTYLAECLEQLSEAMRNGGESASRLQEMAILGRELNDFCIGLKWAAKCTQIKEKKNDQK